MKWNNKFNYPKSTRSIEDGYRKYSLGEEKLPSVTTILNATKSEEEKAALANWKERVGFKEANRIKKDLGIQFIFSLDQMIEKLNY